MFHEKTSWAKCGHETIYLTKDNAPFEPEMCNSCLRKYLAERKKFANGYQESTITEDEKIVMAECGHLEEATMVDGRSVEPKECLDCFTARYERNEAVQSEAWKAVAILGNLAHEVSNGDESDE